MRIYRVSEIVRTKTPPEFVTEKMRDAALGGERIHSALVEKHKGLVRYLEKQQVLMLIRDYTKYDKQPILTLWRA